MRLYETCWTSSICICILQIQVFAYSEFQVKPFNKAPTEVERHLSNNNSYKEVFTFFLKVPSLSSRYTNWRCAITITTQLFSPLKAPFVWKHCSCHKSQVLRVKRKPLILTHRIMRSFIQIFMPPPVLQPSISQDCSRMQCTSSLKEQEAA